MATAATWKSVPDPAVPMESAGGGSGKDAMRTVYIPLNIAEYPETSGENNAYVPARKLTVLGYEWQIGYYPNGNHEGSRWVKLSLTLVTDVDGDVTASFTCRLVDPTERLQPGRVATASCDFWQMRSLEVPLLARSSLDASSGSGYLNDAGNCVAQCAVVVLFHDAVHSAPPPYLGDLLLQKQECTDVTFVVAGESFHAHRCVLVARSPVFKAALLGSMAEKTAPTIEIEEMDADTFRALLHFIYTGTPPPQPPPPSPFDEHIYHQYETQTEETMARTCRLLYAADRYGMERLKTICEENACAGVGVGTVATALATADRHGCAKLKATCMDFLLATPENLLAVAKTEAYEQLESCPSVLSELLKAYAKKLMGIRDRTFQSRIDGFFQSMHSNLFGV